MEPPSGLAWSAGTSAGTEEGKQAVHSAPAPVGTAWGGEGCPAPFSSGGSRRRQVRPASLAWPRGWLVAFLPGEAGRLGSNFALRGALAVQSPGPTCPWEPPVCIHGLRQPGLPRSGCPVWRVHRRPRSWMARRPLSEGNMLSGVLGAPEGRQSRLSLLERGVTATSGTVGAGLGVRETACPGAAGTDEVIGRRTLDRQRSQLLLP